MNTCSSYKLSDVPNRFQITDSLVQLNFAQKYIMVHEVHQEKTRGTVRKLTNDTPAKKKLRPPSTDARRELPLPVGHSNE